jgi:hypothetical protein
VFETLYPPYYLEFLSSIRTALAAEGVVPASSAPFSTEADMRDFLARVGAYLRAEGAFTADDLANFNRGLAMVFDAPYERKLAEAAALRLYNPTPAAESAGAEPQFFTSAEDRSDFLARTNLVGVIGKEAVQSIPAFQGLDAPRAGDPEANRCAPALAREGGRALTRPLLGVVSSLARVFPLTPNAATAACGPTYCVKSPVCFLSGAPKPGGHNLVAACCSGRVCGAPIGCLELCGNGALPFIWDPTTHICGCG